MNYRTHFLSASKSPADLIALVLGDSLRQSPLLHWVEEAPSLLHFFQRVLHINDGSAVPADDLIRLRAVYELTQRLYQRRRGVEVSSCDEAYTLFADMALAEVEHVEVAFLTNQNELIDRREIFVGDLSGAFARPREILREALRLNAAKILVAHNHPSQNPEPSLEDEQFTHQLREACECVGILFVDHLIICLGGLYFSFKTGWQRKFLKQTELPLGLSVRPPDFP